MPSPIAESDTAPALVLENLYKRYNNGYEAVKNLNLKVERGDFFALLGANGAGKSTTIGMITSLIRKSGGKIRIFGIDTEVDFRAAKRRIGLVPQEFNFNLFAKCIDVVGHQAGFYNMPPKIAYRCAEQAIERLGLTDKSHEQVRNLSGGMKRRLMIARAIVHQPDLLILDEPTAGVDLEIRRTVWSFLQEINSCGTTVILTTHYLEEAENLCRNVGIIHHGTLIYQDSMKQWLAQADEETFILDIVAGIMPPALSPVLLSAFHAIKIDENTIEVRVPKSQGLNQLFAELSLQGITVLSLRNKVNRLEELFLKIVHQ